MTRAILSHASPNLLRQLAREHLVQHPGQLTLVPNLPAGRSLQQLTRTMTFTQLARRQLVQAGWAPLSPPEKQQRLTDLLADMEPEYFGPLIERPGTVPALLDVVVSLLRSDAAHVPPGRTPRERDLARLHRRYVLSLLQEGVYDPAVPEFFASRIAVEPQPLTVSGFAYLDPTQIAYLDRLAEESSVMFLAASQADELAEAHRTAAALTARGWDWQELTAENVAENPRLQRTGDRAARQVLRPGSDAELDVLVFKLPSVVAEVREVLRQVKLAHGTEGLPWQELAIVIRDEAAYLPALTETAERYGVPLVTQAKAALGTAALGSFLTAWINAAQGGWRYEEAAAVLTHPLIQLPFDVQQRAKAFGRRSPDGLEVWGDELVLQLLDWPAQQTGRGYLEHLTATLEALGIMGAQRQSAQRQSAQLRLQLASLRQALTPLDSERWLDRSAFLAEVRALIGQARVPVTSQKGGVRVATPLATLGRSFQRVWVLGLSEGQFPRLTPDLPLLDAHLRAFWSAGGVYLPGGTESQNIERALFVHALACAREGLTLTRPEVAPGGRRSEPSPFLRPFGGGVYPTEVYAASAGEARLHLARSGQLEDAEVQALVQVEEQRELGIYPGPQLPGLIDPQRWPWSVSQLHGFGSCRYRWLGERFMRLSPYPEPVRGLDPLARGSLYHLALEQLLQPYVGQAAPAPERLLTELPAAFDAAAQTLLSSGELDVGPLWTVERGTHLKRLRDTVLAPDFLPAGFQISALERPLDGQLISGEGQIWNFRGYADRIDQDERGHLLITDYKLGSYISRVRDAENKLTLEIQLPIYLKLTGAAQGRYFSLNQAKVLEGTGPDWVSAKRGWPAHEALLDNFLESVRRDTERGDYRARPDAAAKACAYCNLQSLCRFQNFVAGDSA